MCAEECGHGRGSSHTGQMRLAWLIGLVPSVAPHSVGLYVERIPLWSALRDAPIANNPGGLWPRQTGAATLVPVGV